MRHLVFRSAAARVAAWAWLVFTALNLVDIAVRGRDLTSLGVLAALLLGCGVAYVLGLRPRVAADERGIRVHNPFRQVEAPWEAVKDIKAGDALVVHYIDVAGTEQKIRSWVLQTSPRAHAKAEARTLREIRKNPAGAAVAEKVKNRTPADFAAEQLTDLATASRRTTKNTTPEVTMEAAATATWSRRSIAALAAPAAFLASILTTSLLR